MENEKEVNLTRRKIFQWGSAIVGITAILLSIILPMTLISGSGNDGSGDGGGEERPPIGDGGGDNDWGTGWWGSKQTFPTKEEAWDVMESSSAGMYSNTWTWNSKTETTANENVQSILDKLTPNSVYYGWYSTIDFRKDEAFITFKEQALTALYDVVSECIKIITGLPLLVDYPTSEEITTWLQVVQDYLNSFDISHNEWKVVLQSYKDQFLTTTFAESTGFIMVSYYETDMNEVYIEATYTGNVLITQEQIDSEAIPPIYHFNNLLLFLINTYNKTTLAFLSNTFTDIIDYETFSNISGISITYEEWNRIVSSLGKISKEYGNSHIVLNDGGGGWTPPGWIPPDWTPPDFIPPITPPTLPPGWTPPAWIPPLNWDKPYSIRASLTEYGISPWELQVSYEDGQNVLYDASYVWYTCTYTDLGDWTIDGYSCEDYYWWNPWNAEKNNGNWEYSSYMHDDVYWKLEQELWMAFIGFEKIAYYLTPNTYYVGWYSDYDFRGSDSFLNYWLDFNENLKQTFDYAMTIIREMPPMIGDYPTEQELWDYYNEVKLVADKYGYTIDSNSLYGLINNDERWIEGVVARKLERTSLEIREDVLSLSGGYDVGAFKVVYLENVNEWYLSSSYSGETYLSNEEIYEPDYLFRPEPYQFNPYVLAKISWISSITFQYRAEFFYNLLDEQTFNDVMGSSFSDWWGTGYNDYSTKTSHTYSISKQFWFSSLVKTN